MIDLLSSPFVSLLFFFHPFADNSYGFNHCSKCETRAGHNNGHVLIKVRQLCGCCMHEQASHHNSTIHWQSLQLAGEVSFMDRLPCGEREFYGESLPSVKGKNHYRTSMFALIVDNPYSVSRIIWCSRPPTKAEITIWSAATAIRGSAVLAIRVSTVTPNCVRCDDCSRVVVGLSVCTDDFFGKAVASISIYLVVLSLSLNHGSTVCGPHAYIHTNNTYIHARNTHAYMCRSVRWRAITIMIRFMPLQSLSMLMLIVHEPVILSSRARVSWLRLLASL